jgi:predicted DNA binding CopG/RHH family protein
MHDSLEFQDESDCKKYFDKMTSFFQNKDVWVELKSNLIISVKYKSYKGVELDKYIRENP